MVHWGLVRIVWVCFWGASLYQVLVYGILQDWPRMAAKIFVVLGYALIISILDSKK